MTVGRAVHVHLDAGSRDASWEESKHPRDAGKFASAPARRGQSERSRGAVALAKAIVSHKDDPKAGKSDYSKAREAELDARRDAEYAQRQKEHAEKERKLGDAARAKAEGMSGQARKNRLAILRTKLDHMSDGLPLREKVAITREIRALEAADKAAAGDPQAGPDKAPQAPPKPAAEAAKKEAKAKELRASYQQALKIGDMSEARRLLRELKKADEELEKGGSGK